MDKRYQRGNENRKSKKNRKHNGQRGNENRKSKKNRKHNGQKIPKG